jgi:hypothetical protein
VLQLALQSFGGADIGEGDGGAKHGAGVIDQRNDLNVQPTCLAAWRVPFDVTQRNRQALGACLIDIRPDLDRSVGDLEILNRTAEFR